MRQRVVIVGGGIAGLTAAHELVERDFEVHLYERRTYFGGKAASVRRDKDAKHAAVGEGDPGEHGFRFYPGWYRHLPDTMKRIPYKGNRSYYQGATVHDNLVEADAELLTWYDREPVRVLVHPPRTLAQAADALAVAGQFARLGLAPGEVAFFFRKIAEFLATPESQRQERFDQMTWWEYLEADKKSQAFRDLIAATTRTMVAAKAKQASAFTIGTLAVRTLFDMFGSVDRMMNGPTSEVWIKPWIEYLKDRGVRFYPGYELDCIEFDVTSKTVKTLHFDSQLQHSLQRLRWVLTLAESWKRALQSLPKIPPEQALRLAAATKVRKLAAEWRRQADELGGEADVSREMWIALKDWPPSLLPKDLQAAVPDAVKQAAAFIAETLKQASHYLSDAADHAMALSQSPPSDDVGFARKVLKVLARRKRAFLALKRLCDSAARQQLEQASAEAPKTSSPDASAYVFALPLEQMAYYVNRSQMATQYDPDLRRLLLLAEHTDWMVGIQYFLTEKVDLVPGHVVCMDSEWSLTAVEQTQYWREVDLPSDIRAVISVDIASWDRKGRFNQKEAFNCTNEEIAIETWNQLRESLNRKSRASLLDNRMLRGGKPEDPQAHFLDPSLVDILDRKKQASYEKARGVNFSIDELMRRQRTSGHETETPFIWGRRLRFNVEPLLVNRVGTHALRPGVRTKIPNMFLAADYVRTTTDLACMESANEAGRRVTNAILDATASSKERCQVWSFSIAKDILSRIETLAGIGDRVAAAAGATRKVADVMRGGAGRAAGELLTRIGWRRQDG